MMWVELAVAPSRSRWLGESRGTVIRHQEIQELRLDDIINNK